MQNCSNENLLIDPRVYDPKFKGGYEVTSSELPIYAIRSNGTFLQRILTKDRMLHEICGSEVPRQNKLFEILDRKIQQLFATGIISHLIDLVMKDANPKRYSHLYPDDGPKVLTMEHLQAGFKIWLFSLSLAIIAFIVEWLSRFKKISCK